MNAREHLERCRANLAGGWAVDRRRGRKLRRLMHPREAWWLATTVTIQWLWPGLVSIAQSWEWAARWRRTVDKACRWPVQFWALVYVAAIVGMWRLLGPNLMLVLGAAPALVVVTPALGRVAYRRVPARKARAKYHPQGWATWREVRELASPHASRTIAERTSPLFAEKVRSGTGRPSAVALARMPISVHGTWQGDVAVGLPFPSPIVVPHEGAVALVAAPRAFKTAHMGHHIIDHVLGAVLNTQTRGETYRQTRELRRRISRSGRGVHLLDPENVTGEGSSFRWSPVAGCREPHVAMMRAAAFAVAAGSPGEHGEWFASRASVVLRAMLLIADICGRSMADVAAWASAPPDYTRKEIGKLLLDKERRDRVPMGWVEEMTAVLNTEAKQTRDAIMMCLAKSVAFMSDPAVAALCTPEDDAAGFDVEAFLADRGTLYLIATERKWAAVGPLLAAFTSHVFAEAQRVAARRDSDRLDPVLLMELDEAAHTIAMPLDEWVPVAGGSGIHIVYSVQSRSQLRQRLGRDGADTVWNATTTKLIGGALTVEEDLEALSKLCTYRVLGDDGEWITRTLLNPAELREIPRWHALLVHGSMRVTIVRLRPVWARLDVIAARLVPWTRPAELAEVITMRDQARALSAATDPTREKEAA